MCFSPRFGCETSGLDFEQHFQIRAGQALPGRLARNDGIGDAAQRIPEVSGSFLDRILADHLVGEDLTGLADAVSAVRGLVFHGEFHPWVVVDDVVSCGQIQACRRP